MIKKSLLLFLLCLTLSFNAGCVLRNTGPNEVGVCTKKIAIIGQRGVEQKVYLPGRTFFILPILNDWHTYDTKIQNMEMTIKMNQGDVKGEDDLKFKTIDGNDISLDVVISYRIIPDKAPYILEYVAKNNKELRSKIVRVVTRSRTRDLFGELKTEDFYKAENRALKAEKAKEVLNKILNEYGVVVENVLTKDYRFNSAYQQAIEDKKIAEQRAEQNKSAAKAKEEEYKRRLEEAKGEYNKMKADADGEYERAKIEALAYYAQQANLAKAIETEAVADAKGIKEMNKALAQKGGKVMVKLKIAEALKNKKIYLLPNSANGINLKTLDMNSFLQLEGLNKVSKQRASTKAVAK
jgi:regulator of protease activity HflC (stomatin/prohibitin superfamily)